ncbi:AraC family transcriptional regulator [Pseudomonas sp. DTU_2021_1001937_2_SI_NGA_ILE_001]|uniref:AraC family transcriptional regulator n=1 Tax=Pseudomonas sp. DTU_2021_1001937_2_SI_NGA_ILE_001 TaxID=3077589 RepID=UPI0025E0E7F2|nr:AraC family transcriptional regulator [Pseudomonas sp. DTU_2021_1001937_2_SI_NGA_ILE_001]WNW10310.1 AraC family transcriptional regulator [Pseudomonas sp. DTU_2021_1001937_2_SI_NGA_ILE_001]
MLHTHLTTLNAVSLILETLREDGVPARELLVGSGIDEADLARPDPRITTAQEARVCANALALRETFGLELGQRMHVSSYGVLGYAMLLSDTLGSALELALRYPALLGTLFELHLEVRGEQAWLLATHYRSEPELAVFNAELCLGSLKVICDDLLGRPLPLQQARFAHPAPVYSKRYRRNFPCPVSFDAVEHGFAFPAEWLRRPLPLADRLTHRAMAERCRQQNAEFTGRQAWLGRIRQHLAEQLASPPGLEGLARQMNCSSRSLRRHLHDMGSSYQALLDSLRFERAKMLLAEQQWPVQRVAEALGYSETASFRHAFVRWSGIAPSHYRT